MNPTLRVRTSHAWHLGKMGVPCRAVGTIFDPEWNGMVCDAHARPDINVNLQRRMHGYAPQAREALAEQRRAREALMLSLSDNGLNSVLKDLRNFRDGKPIQPKVRKILEGVLRKNKGYLDLSLPGL